SSRRRHTRSKRDWSSDGALPISTVADTASIAGASMSEMGNIFGSVAARGKLQGDDLMQLQSRGIPVLQLLAEELGKTSAEVSERSEERRVGKEGRTRV